MHDALACQLAELAVPGPRAQPFAFVLQHAKDGLTH